MSDTQQEPGWWLASDGKWYPPDIQPDPPLSKPPDATSVEAVRSGDLIFCTHCGTPGEALDRYCRLCGVPTLSSPASAHRFFGQRIDFLKSSASLEGDVRAPTFTPKGRRNAVLLLSFGAFVTIAALFPSYYAGGLFLSRSGQDLGYNIPIIVGMLVASGLLLTRRGWPTGAGVAAAVVVVDCISFITDWVDVGTGQSKPGLGFALGSLGWLLATFGTILAVRSLLRTGRGFMLETGPVTAIWAVLGVIVSTLWAVGWWLPDVGYHLHLMSSTFNGTGTARITHTCCNVLLDHQPADYVAQTILLIVLAFGLPLLAALFLWHGFGKGLLLGTAVALSAEWFSSVFASSAIAPSNFGWTVANATQYGFTASWFPTIGFILLGLGTFGLFLLTVARFLLRS